MLIDDGSTDSSADICNSYVIEDRRFKYYKKENGGVSSARNFGLDKATNEYIAFIDADDCIHKKYVEYLMKGAQGNGCEVVRCRVSQEEKILEEDVEYKFIKTEQSLHGYVHSSIYLRSVIGNIRFDERFYYNEDILFDASVIGRTVTCGIVDSKLYYYRKNPNSATSTFKSERYFSGLSALNEAISKFSINWETKNNIVHSLLIHRELCRLKYAVALSYEKKPNALDLIKVQRKDFYEDCRQLGHISNKHIKLAAWIFKLPLSISLRLFRLVGIFWNNKKGN